MTRHEGRWVCWVAAGVLGLLWILYIIEHMIGQWGELPHGVATFFLAVEFTLGQIAINLGRNGPAASSLATQVAADRADELVGRFVALLEQNNAVVADSLERAIKQAFANLYVEGMMAEGGTVHRFPGQPGRRGPPDQGS